MTQSAAETIPTSEAHPITATFSDFLRGLRCWYRRRRDLKEARLAFLHMICLDDRLLDDAGATREEVLWAASLPLDINAALALQARSSARRAAQPRR